jgi:Na+-driven multidrug efflux pump
MNNDNNNIEYLELLKFYIPLVIMSMLIMASHNVINIALAKTAAPALALAAYSVGRSLSRMIESPMYALTRLTPPISNNKLSIESLMKVVKQVTVGVLVIMAIIAFTPLGEYIFINIMGVEQDLFADTLLVFRFLMLMPIITAIRIPHQGFIVLKKKTTYLTLGTTLRIIGIVVSAWFLTSVVELNSGVIGAIILVIGMGIEAIVAFIKGRDWPQAVPKSHKDEDLNYGIKDIWKFFIPLVIARIVFSFINPSINGTLARATRPEIAISGYFVARSLAWVLIAVGFRIHQMVVVYANNQQNFYKIRKLVLSIALLMSILIAILAFSPAGLWVLHNIIGVEDEIAQPALSALAFFVLVPPIYFTSELYQGTLLKLKKSKSVTICRSINVGSMFVSLLILTALFPEMGSAIGSASVAIGYGVEAIAAFVQYRLIAKKELSWS